jgi:hypothetical protein
MAGKPQDQGITWLASYPKSGNTWLRLLLEAYRRNGALDINDVRICRSDGSATVIQSVSPMPLEPLNLQGELLLRPAGLLNLRATGKAPFLIKTHYANLTFEDCAPNIPPQFTSRAIYIVRDPRCVLPSFSKHYGMSLQQATKAMNNPEFCAGGKEGFTRSWASTWSNHAASWVSETKFPVHVVKYEELRADTVGELTKILDFLEWQPKASRVRKAVKATEFERLKKVEEKDGFIENKATQSDTFFNGASMDWREEIGEKWARHIEEDHREVMQNLGYLEKGPTELTAIS